MVRYFILAVVILVAELSQPPAVEARGADPVCLTDARAERWQWQVQDMFERWRADPLRGTWERIRPDTPGGVRVVRDSRVCAKALQHLRRQLPGALSAAISSLCVLRLPNGGYVVIVPGQVRGEWQVSHWFDRYWVRRPIAIGI